MHVAHEEQRGAQRHGLQQVVHEHGVHHGRLVHHQQAAGEGVVLVAGETVLLGAVLQQTVDGLGFAPAGLGHALGGATRGRGQQYLGARFGKDLDDGVDDGGLAGAGAAGKHHDLGAGGGAHGLQLLRRKGDGQLGQHLGDDRLRVLEVHGFRRTQHPLQIVGDLGFVMMVAGKEHAEFAVHFLDDDALLDFEGAQGVFHEVGADVQLVRGVGDQRIVRHVDVAVVVQALQGVQGARLCPQFAVAREAQLFRDDVGGVKADAVDVHGQAVGILAHHRQGLLPVVAVDAHGIGGADPVRLQEHDQVADALMVGPARLDALQRLAAHAADPQQPVRLLVQHAKGVLAEGIHDACGHGFAHALDEAGTEIMADALHGCGQQVLVVFHGKLPPEARVVHPAAHQLQRCPRLRRNHVPHHADHVALGQRAQAQHGVAVFLVVEDDAVEHAGKLLRCVLRLLHGGQHGRGLA